MLVFTYPYKMISGILNLVISGFSKNKSDKKNNEPYIEGYTYHLSDQLRREHAQILAVIVSISYFLKKKKLVKVQAHMGVFRELFLNHVIREKTTIYQELKNHIVEEGVANDLQGFKMEMENLQKDILAFLKKWRKVVDVEKDMEGFKIEIEGIGRVLHFRFEKEDRIIHEFHREIPNYLDQLKSIPIK